MLRVAINGLGRIGRAYLRVQHDPVELPRQEMGVDLVIESTGKLRTRESAGGHLKSGARRVLISAPGKGVDATLVPGVNDGEYEPVHHEILSAASCTTNCAAPMVKVLHDTFGALDSSTARSPTQTRAAPVAARAVPSGKPCRVGPMALPVRSDVPDDETADRRALRRLR
ncbi:Glyceraldehyde 3-phosphate dehydrogenase, NAD binding domain [Asanoa hainanensis]|uniref:Glyceraldehyde 3-phosphate dehydrogenase, NAD binding domain n=1 Tax=Asanoa hainanensis TaxID=560556 RepID=A0A239P280_9ACTN|nr:hypothetical protein [Asanoa hainanensis]SNT60843.1 Glyceraldehyde 3-phosphate dehydrogenase, NAD binding domain [Asanoa hainanensis]